MPQVKKDVMSNSIHYKLFVAIALEKEGINSSDLGRKVGKGQSTVFRQTEELVKAKLVKKENKKYTVNWKGTVENFEEFFNKTLNPQQKDEIKAEDFSLLIPVFELFGRDIFNRHDTITQLFNAIIENLITIYRTINDVGDIKRFEGLDAGIEDEEYREAHRNKTYNFIAQLMSISTNTPEKDDWVKLGEEIMKRNNDKRFKKLEDAYKKKDKSSIKVLET